MFASQHGRCHKINKGVLFEFQVSPGLATQVLTRNVGARVNHTTNASQAHRPVRGYLSPPVGGNGLKNPLQLFYESGCNNQCSLETFVVLSLDKTGTGEKNYKSLGQA